MEIAADRDFQGSKEMKKCDASEGIKDRIQVVVKMKGVSQQARGSFTSSVSTGGFLQAATPFYMSTALDVLSAWAITHSHLTLRYSSHHNQFFLLLHSCFRIWM
jgi:hypothetical protein